MGLLEDLLKKLWDDYAALNPQASVIHAILAGRGEAIQNDHIAFRTLAHPTIDIAAMAKPFLALGYVFVGKYSFTEKKLNASHLEHPDPKQPKVFISELRYWELSQGAQSILLGMLNQISPTFLTQSDWCVGGRPWDADFTLYEALARESEYAAWLFAFGFRANHFTVFANALRTFPDLPALNQFLKSQGFRLNDSGGEIKGSAAIYLEQSSTMADSVEAHFKSGKKSVPGCYYEFARRYLMPNGKMFQGFNEKSADKIFESTDRRGG